MKNAIDILQKPLAPPVADNKFFFIHCLFSSVHALLLAGFVCYQFVQPLFLNSETWIFVYLMLFLAFSADFAYFYFHEKVRKAPMFQWIFLFTDAILMTVCLSVAVPALYAVLIFVYMFQIFGAGLLGGYKGAFAQGLWVSFLLTSVLIFSPLYAGGGDSVSLALSFALNNMGFMFVAGLSGFLGAQAQKLEWRAKGADQVAQKLENLNQLIAQNINMGLFIVDESSTVIYSNPKALSVLGLPEGFSSSVYKVFPELKAYITSKESATGRLQVEAQKENCPLSLDVFFSPLQEEELKPAGEPDQRKHLILFQDCTALRELEKKAREKEKLAGIGRMAAGIAHEIRNPLSSIGGSIQLLDIYKKDASENKRLMDMALREISRLNCIVSEFLDYASDEDALLKVPLESININPVLEEMLDHLRVNPKWEHITYHFTLKSHAIVEGHKDKFKQIFLNIVKNACEAMEEQPKGRLEVESFDDRDQVVVRVKDTGVGISDKDMPRIFEPFYSGKVRGTGLGLPIVRKLILWYKGNLSYEKQEEGGTICTIRFPIQPNFCPGEMAKRKSA